MTTIDEMRERLEEMATFLEKSANIALVDGLPSAASVADLSARWASDAALLREEFGSDEAASWIGTTTGLYLAEAAHEVTAIAALLRAGVVTASLSPLIRSILERLGVVGWILDVETDTAERAWRAVLNALMSYKYYREAIDRLGAASADQNAVAKSHRLLRANARTWFAPDVDASEPEESSRWTRGGSGFPDYTDLAAAAMPSSMPLQVRRGMYAAQCGMTHPNILVLGETIRPSATSQAEFFHRPEDIEKLVRAAFATFLGGLKVWSRYFNTAPEFETFVLQLDEFANQFDALFAANPSDS
jgi:hypothetical protein